MNFLYGKEVVQRLDYSRGSTKESKNSNPPTACIIFTGPWFFSLYLLVITSLWLYNHINVLCHNIFVHLWHNIFTHTYTHAGSLVLEKHVFMILTLFFILKNEPIQTKMIVQNKVMLGRTLYLILLTLVVNI